MAETTLKLEEYNFHIDSTGWKKIAVDSEEYLENPEGDVWEILNSEAKGEQLFTWDAAMRETQRAGKRMPTREEFKILKTKSDIPNLIFAGWLDTDRSSPSICSDAIFWSSTESGSFLAGSIYLLGEDTIPLIKRLWYFVRGLWWSIIIPHYTPPTGICYGTNDKSRAFSVRCLKD